MECTQNKGNSSLLLQLAERVGNAAEMRNPQPVNQPSLNATETSAITDVDGAVLEISTVKDFFKVNSRVTAIEMKPGLCNDSQIQEWNLSAYSKLVELVVGDDCLQYVKELVLSGFARLESVAIGMRCFSSSFDGEMEVSGCGALKRVVVGDGCCERWSSFVVRNCDSLQEVSIGDGCFVRCENAVFESMCCLDQTDG